MKVESIPFGKFFSNKNTIYKNIMIVSKRARQIMDERYSKVESLKNIEDTDELIEIDEDEIAKPKCISIAMQELMDLDLNCADLEPKEENAD
jgi:DNA-directed RNA polymerase subunit K/omega